MGRLKKLSVVSVLLLFPILVNACGMGALGYSGLAELFLIVIGVFLAGYIPYLVLSILLARKASKPEGASKKLRGWALAFALLNTTVFLIGVGFIAEEGIELFVADLLLWGIPFLFFIKGFMAKPKPAVVSTGSDILDEM